MNFDTYQQRALETAIYPEATTGSFAALSYTVLGLTNEAGEVAGKVKKVWRDNDGELTEEKKDQIADELSDVLWYVATAAREINYSLEDIAWKNVDKLKSRKDRGVLGGSGDTR